MAIIGKIRDRFGVVISIIIGLSLLGFLLMSALDSQSSLFRSRNTTIAKVEGEKIDYNDFVATENHNIEQYELFNQNGGSMTDQIRQSIKEQSWTEILQNTVMQKKYDQLGIDVSVEEMKEQLAGNNPHAVIRQQFTDPKTQIYSPANVTRFLNSDVYKNNQDNWQKRWSYIEEYVRKDRYSNKFNKMIAKGIYVPKFMAEMDFKDKNDKINFAFAYVPFSKITDDQVKVTDAEVKEYAEKHIRRFAVDEDVRKIEFVTFDLNPSAVDSAAFRNNMMALVDSFHHTKNDSIMVAANSETDVDGKFYTKEKLASVMKDSLFSKPVKAVVGPYFEAGFIKISKIISHKIMPDSVRASHILINVKQGEDTAVANRRIDSIWNVIKKGAKFSDMAAKFSDDQGSKIKNGDLGYFAQGMMVPTFNDACFNGKKGDIVKVVSQFGVHLILITDQKKFNPAVQVFTIAKTMAPSKATEQAVSAKANEFASKNNSATAFDQAAKNIKHDAGQIKKNDANIMGINGNARDMVKTWVYGSDTKVGNVSSAFLIENKMYVVAKLSSILEKGQADLDQYRAAIESEIKKQKRTDIITKEITSKIAGKTDMASIAAAIGDSVHRVNNLAFVQPFMSIGYEPKLVGAAFALKPNSISKPIAGNAGVFVVMNEGMIVVPVPTDLRQNKMQLESQYGSGMEYGLFNNIKKHLEIKDNRSDFF